MKISQFLGKTTTNTAMYKYDFFKCFFQVTLLVHNCKISGYFTCYDVTDSLWIMASRVDP